MHDDESDGGISNHYDNGLDYVPENRAADFFGDFSVLGTGVQIVLEGRTVTSSCR